MEFLRWSASRGIIEVPIVDTTPKFVTAGASIGTYIKCPKFDGDFSKVLVDDIHVIRLCDGKLTPEQIAETLNMPLPKVLQTIAKYRKAGLKMIGRTT